VGVCCLNKLALEVLTSGNRYIEPVADHLGESEVIADTLAEKIFRGSGAVDFPEYSGSSVPMPWRYALSATERRAQRTTVLQRLDPLPMPERLVSVATALATERGGTGRERNG
jgi:hypothetical protein